MGGFDIFLELPSEYIEIFVGAVEKKMCIVISGFGL